MPVTIDHFHHFVLCSVCDWKEWLRNFSIKYLIYYEGGDMANFSS